MIDGENPIKPKSDDKRIKFTRKELMDSIVEVQQCPESIMNNLGKKFEGRGNHLISLYPVKPMGCQLNPFYQHKPKYGGDGFNGRYLNRGQFGGRGGAFYNR